MTERRIGRRTDVPWEKIRRAFIISGNISAIAKEYGLSRWALYKRLNHEGWREQRRQIVHRAQRRADANAAQTVADRIRQDADLAASFIADLAELRKSVMTDVRASSNARIEAMRSLVDALQRASRMHLEYRARLGESFDPPAVQHETTIYEVVVKRADGSIGPAESLITSPAPEQDARD